MIYWFFLNFSLIGRITLYRNTYIDFFRTFKLDFNIGCFFNFLTYIFLFSLVLDLDLWLLLLLTNSLILLSLKFSIKWSIDLITLLTFILLSIKFLNSSILILSILFFNIKIGSKRCWIILRINYKVFSLFSIKWIKYDFFKIIILPVSCKKFKKSN